MWGSTPVPNLRPIPTSCWLSYEMIEKLEVWSKVILRVFYFMLNLTISYNLILDNNVKLVHPRDISCVKRNNTSTRYPGKQSQFQAAGYYIMAYLTRVGVVTRSSPIRFVIPMLICGINRLYSYWLCRSLIFRFYRANRHISFSSLKPTKIAQTQ